MNSAAHESDRLSTRVKRGKMTISDAGTTLDGAPAAAIAPTVTNATSKVFKVLPSQADPVTGNVTLTHSVTATVTYKMTLRA